jgi:hypothetical protein
MRIHLQHATSFASIGVIAVIIAFTIQVNTKPFPSEGKTIMKNCLDTSKGKTILLPNEN